jgi:hypothetical protein
MARAYAEENNIMYMETSAKTAQNVNELFVAIARKLPKGPGSVHLLCVDFKLGFFMSLVDIQPQLAVNRRWTVSCWTRIRPRTRAAAASK